MPEGLSPVERFHTLQAVLRFAVSNLETLKQVPTAHETSSLPHEPLKPLKLLKQLKLFKQ